MVSVAFGVVGASIMITASTDSVVFGVAVSQPTPSEPSVANVRMKATERAVYSLDLELGYDPAQASIRDIRFGSLASGMTMAVNTNRPGVILAALAGATAISGEGNVLEVSFNATTRPSVQLTRVSVNEGTVPSRVQTAVRLAGKVRYHAGGKMVPGVSIYAHDVETNPVSSASNGSFELMLDAGGNYTLRPVKESDDRMDNGVTTSDITFIRRHLLFIQALDSPYAVLAADVNDSSSVTTTDITFIRRVILHIDDRFPGTLWKFVRADQTFNDLRNPWSHENSRNVTALAFDMDNQDFIAMRAGDVNGTWSQPVATQGSNSTGERSGRVSLMGRATAASVTLRLAGEFAASETLAKVRLKAVGFTKVTSLQFTLQWDPAILQYAGVTELGLAELGPGNFGTTLAESGKLLFSWDDPNGVGVTLVDGSPMFTLELSPIGGQGIVNAVSIGDDPTVREVTVNGMIGNLVTEHGGFQKGAPAPSIQIVVTSDDFGRKVAVAVLTVSGTNYVLEATESLGSPEWQELGRVAGDGTVKVLLDGSRRESQRFYRVRMEP